MQKIEQKSRYHQIIGEGEIGDKAKQLILKSPKLHGLGFDLPYRTILAQTILDGFLEHNKLSTIGKINTRNDIIEAILMGSFSSEQQQVIQNVSNYYDKLPLIIRSSAKGDARGTGTYTSKFIENKPKELGLAIKRVLASYFTQSAQDFRRDANTGKGFGIMIEPIIGQACDHGRFAPIVSGFGYSSTSRDEAYLNVVPGLGGGVEARGGEKIGYQAIQEYKGNLMDYIDYLKYDSDLNIERDSGLLRLRRGRPVDSYSGFTFNPDHPDPIVPSLFGGYGHLDYEYPNEYNQLLGKVNLGTLFKGLKKLEQLYGPQYIERAITIKNGQQQNRIAQIDNVSKKLDSMDFDCEGKALFSGHTATGTGIKECKQIVHCYDPEDIKHLHEFNKKHKDYVLFYSSRLTTSVNKDRPRYEDFSNASVFLELQDARHSGDPLSHLGGQLDMTGKLFAVLDYYGDIRPQRDTFEAKTDTKDGLQVYRGKVKVIASERQNKLIIVEQ